jgi:hypothetical protein
LRSGKSDASETIYKFIERILPEDFRGYETVVHSRTGYALHPTELKPRAQDILNKLNTTRERAIYGNSFFFSDYLRHSAYPLRDLRETFGEEGAQQILDHLMDILEGRVVYSSYPETYSAQREALRALRQIYFMGFGFGQEVFPVKRVTGKN